MDEELLIIDSRQRPSKSFNDSIKKAYNIEGNKISVVSAIWNITNFIQGISLLGLPYGILMGSWAGIVLNVMSGYICCSTGKILIDCLYEEIDGEKFRVLRDYPDIGTKIWPRFGRGLILLFSLTDMLGAAILYLILFVSSLHILFENLMPNFNHDYWFLIGTSVILLNIFVTNIELISKFSFLSIISLFITIISILIYCFMNSNCITIFNFPKISFYNISISTGIIVFSFTGHPLFPAIEASMKQPNKFKRAINISFLIGTITKTIFGILPVLLFGFDIKQSITDNISHSHFMFYYAINIGVVINCFFSLPMLIYIVSECLDQILLYDYFPTFLWPNERLNIIWLILSRLLIIFTILFIALVVPFFGLVMSFIGSVTATFISILMPCFCSLILKHKVLTRTQKCYRVFIIIFGLVTGIIGAIISGDEIMHRLIIH